MESINFIEDKVRIITATVCLSMIFILNLTIQPKNITIKIDDEVHEIITIRNTVEKVLEEQKIKIEEGDWIDLEKDHIVENNMEIHIIKAKKYIVNHDGCKTSVYFHESDVQKILTKANIEMGEKDIIQADLKNNTIDVIRVTHEYTQQEDRIFYKQKKVPSNELEVGEKKVVQEGIEGEKLITYRFIYHDGQLKEKDLINEQVIREKQDEIVEYGTREKASRGANKGKEVVIVTATAYCSGIEGTGCPVDHRGWSSCTGAYSNGYTSTGKKAIAGDGTKVNPHIIAVDPKVIPLETLLYIDGLGYAYSADVGGAILGNRIDILMPSHLEATSYGRQKGVRVYIIE